MPPRKARGKRRARSPAARGAPHRLRRWRFVPELSDLADLEPGLTISSLADALAAAIRSLTRMLGKLPAATTPRSRSTPPSWATARSIAVAAGAASPRRSISCSSTGEQPAAMFARSLIVVERGARVDADREPRRPGRQRLPGQCGARSGDRRRRPCRSRQDRRRRRRRAASLDAHGRRSARGARFNDFAFITGGAVVRNQLFVRFDGEGTVAASPARACSRPPARRHDAGDRSRRAGGCDSRELFKSVLDGESHGVFQGKIIVAPRRAEDRRQDDDAGAAAVGRGRSRQQAGAGNLCRRRAVRPRRDLRRARRRTQCSI